MTAWTQIFTRSQNNIVSLYKFTKLQNTRKCHRVTYTNTQKIYDLRHCTYIYYTKYYSLAVIRPRNNKIILPMIHTHTHDSQLLTDVTLGCTRGLDRSRLAYCL